MLLCLMIYLDVTYITPIQVYIAANSLMVMSAVPYHIVGVAFKTLLSADNILIISITHSCLITLNSTLADLYLWLVLRYWYVS